MAMIERRLAGYVIAIKDVTGLDTEILVRKDEVLPVYVGASPTIRYRGRYMILYKDEYRAISPLEMLARGIEPPHDD